MWWVFTEDERGRRGILSPKHSGAVAKDLAADYPGITYVRYYPTSRRVEAKRYFKAEIARKGLSEGHKNIRNDRVPSET